MGEHHESEDQSQDGPVSRPRRDTTAHQPSSSWSIRGIIRPIIHLVRNPALRHSPTHATTRSPVPHLPNVHRHSTTAHNQGENVVHELSIRVARSVEICKTRKLLSNNDLWQKRTRACIEATVSLVCCANANIAWFGGIPKLLGDIGGVEEIRKLSLAGMDELFVMRWTCLSLVAIRPILADSVQYSATQAMKRFAEEDDTGNNDVLSGAQKIEKARRCLFRLFDALRKTEDLTEEVEEILLGHESQISELEQISIEADRLESVDSAIYSMQDAINDESHQIISHFPGVLDDFDLYYEEPIPFSRVSRDPRKLQFIRPRQTLKSMCFPALTLRNILEGQGDADAYKELLKDLNKFQFQYGWQGDEIERQLWRLQDLRDGGGLGFTVELFFLALSQLLSTPSSKESHSELYTGTFRAITSDWSKHKHSLGTQKLLLNTVMSHCWFFQVHCPAYIVDEFLLLLGNIFEGQTGPHIDGARQRFEFFIMYGPTRFTERMSSVLTRP